MLHHLNLAPRPPRRVVVLGAGFVGGETARRLDAEGTVVKAIRSGDLDLLEAGAPERLADLLDAEDFLVVVSAKAPVKTHAMLIDNLRMMDAVTSALAKQPVSHVVYVSSDAVYADSDAPLTETSCAQPTSLHGAMHLTREVMLTNAWNGPLCLVRPTLIYGANDPHNGYGPNRFRRLAQAGEDIVLFGAGEERRDHVLVDDVAELISLIIKSKSVGVLNAATGTVASFREVADMTAQIVNTKVAITTTPRTGPMPHNGYRPFDPSATARAFPGFRYATLPDGLRRAAGQPAS